MGRLYDFLQRRKAYWDQPIMVIPSSEGPRSPNPEDVTAEEVADWRDRLLNATFPPEQEQALRDWQMRQIEILNEEEDTNGE